MYASMGLLSEQLGAARMGIYTDTEKMKIGEREWLFSELMSGFVQDVTEFVWLLILYG